MPIIGTPTGPCDNWGLTWADVTARGCGSCSKITSEAAQAQILEAAVNLAWAATGRRYGVCTETLRPCLGCDCGSAYNECGCFVYQRIDLDPAQDMGGISQPIQSIGSVTLLGVPLLPGTDYALGENRWLYRLPRGELWPACQDIGAVPAPVEIEVGRGWPPPRDLILLGVLPLAREMAANDCGDPCSIDPSKVQSVQREGISFALISKGDAWKEGLTGDQGIDAAILRACEDDDDAGGMSDPLEVLRPRFARTDLLT